jgi:hypothetical protein
MTTTASLISRVRLELGDMGKSFVKQFIADGSTNRFKLDVAPLDAPSIIVYLNGADITSFSHVEESTGVLILQETNGDPLIPLDGDELLVSGTYYRYFTNAEMLTIVNDAIAQHTSGHTDSLGRLYTPENLPTNEEYPVAIYAVTIALYTLATDASFDIDISAPDGVNIPRSERYRQLMDMVQARQAQYRDLCVQLGVGLYKIDVFTFRRISKATGRYVPVYKPQEVDDRSYPQRVEDSLPTYGDKQVPWVTDGGELTAYQGRAFIETITWSGTYDPSVTFVAKLLSQRGSVQHLQDFTCSVSNTGTAYTATISLTADQTLRLGERTYWSIQEVDPNNTDPNSGTILPVEVKGGNFFTVRVSQVVL